MSVLRVPGSQLEELRQHLLHLHPEVEPEPDWWDRDAVEPPLLW